MTIDFVRVVVHMPPSRVRSPFHLMDLPVKANMTIGDVKEIISTKFPAVKPQHLTCCVKGVEISDNSVTVADGAGITQNEYTGANYIHFRYDEPAVLTKAAEYLANNTVRFLELSEVTIKDQTTSR